LHQIKLAFISQTKEIAKYRFLGTKEAGSNSFTAPSTVTLHHFPGYVIFYLTQTHMEPDSLLSEIS